MKYEKPNVVLLASAIEAVQSSLAKQAPQSDIDELTTVSAYQADE